MKKIKTIENKFANKKISQSEMKLMINKIKPKYGSLEYFDVDKNDVLFRSTLLSPLIIQKDQKNPKDLLVSVKDAIDDLREDGSPESQYVKKINKIYLNQYNQPLNKLMNHELRHNKNLVRARFRLYQVLNKLLKIESKEILKHLKTESIDQISESTLKSLTNHWLLDLNGRQIIKPSLTQTIGILSALHTKKQTQKALIADLPAPAALSIPDDACHYHESILTQRTLSVREMSRIQSFPDWFVVKSKITTGGKMRRFEVPQYTQIGNAVPPILGISIGLILRNLLEHSKVMQ